MVNAQEPTGSVLVHPIVILPCPFCGGDKVDVAEGTTFRWRQARCLECGASAGEVRIQTFGDDGNKEQWEEIAERDALMIWNQREAK